MATSNLPYSDQVIVTATFFDGVTPTPKEAPVTNVTATIDDTAIATIGVVIQVSPSQYTVEVIAVGALGNAVLTISGTNSQGQVVSATQDFSVVESPAASVVIVVGTPVAKS
jgi:hypothetical protein